MIGGRGEGGNIGELTGESPRRLKSLPKNFFAPGVFEFLGVEGVAGVAGVAVSRPGVVGAGVCVISSDVSESAEEVGV